MGRFCRIREESLAAEEQDWRIFSKSNEQRSEGKRVRDTLFLALKQTFGINNLMQDASEDQLREAYGHSHLIVPSEKDVNQFATHGLTNIKVEFPVTSPTFLIVDLKPLLGHRGENRLSAWIKQRNIDHLSLVIASERQKKSPGHTMSDPNGTIEGIRIGFHHKFSMGVLYKNELEFISRPGK